MAKSMAKNCERVKERKMNVIQCTAHGGDIVGGTHTHTHTGCPDNSNINGYNLNAKLD